MKILKRTKYLFLLFLLILSFSLFANNARSQEESQEENQEEVQEEKEDLDQTLRRYQESYNRYQDAHEDYFLARSQYLRFETLQSQEEAREATLQMLQRRDEVVINYLRALKAKLEDATNVNEENRNILSLRIDDEIEWYSEHLDRLPSAATLEDLVSDSNEARNRHRNIEPLAYEVLAFHSVGEVEAQHQKLLGLFSEVEEKLNEIRNEDREEYKLSEQKTQRIDRWLLESENRLIRGEGKQLEAMDMVNNSTNLGGYNNVVSTLREAIQYYKESASFLRETISETKKRG